MNVLRGNAVSCVIRRSVPSAQRISSSRFPAWPHNTALRRFTTSQISHRKQEQQIRDDSEPISDGKEDNQGQDRKSMKNNVAKTSSLRRVAVEAQRSRGGFVKGKGNKRFIDPEVDTKTVTAYCAAEQYNISAAAGLIKAQGYQLDPYQTGLYPQVIHVQTSERPSEARERQGRGDIFIFPSGTVVTWNVRDGEALSLINRVLPPAAEGSHLELLESEDLEFVEDPSRESSEIIGDTIVLGTKAQSEDFDAREEVIVRTPAETATATNENEAEDRHEVDTILAKIAFSSGLARSAKLAVLESLLSSYQQSTRSIPMMLAKGSKLPFSRSFVLRKTGELLSLRAQLNLYSELTDSLPDIFWDSRHELGLGEYYDQVGRALDVGVRIRTLNEKIGFAQEIASVLRESLSEKHGLRLEWAIIALIAVEVVLEFYRHWKEVDERDDPGSTESLLRKYLEETKTGAKPT